MKSLRSLAKRIKFTSTGKAMRRRAGMSHNLLSKSRKRKRHLKHQVVVVKPIARKIKKLIPNS